ncbi:MAG: site-specific DNA-methyltransferase [Rhodospirillaceae bacterium]|nr:site-specific DNA-methyltransferase [Rhodospirillaceae bacterium]
MRRRTGYPTQKPLALLDRIIRASTNEGDVVFDPFCGCATALVAADRLRRKSAAIDLSASAVKLVDDRIAEGRATGEPLIHQIRTPYALTPHTGGRIVPA